MNKEKWISALLDGTVSDNDVLMLLDMSFDATFPKTPRKKHTEEIQ